MKSILAIIKGNQMPNRIVLAEYFTTDDITLLFGVRVDWSEPKVVEIKQPLTEIRNYASNFGSGEEGGSKLLDLDLTEWQERFGCFVDPILQWADPGDYLYLVPHDALHYLPLHALKVDGKYLIERNPIVYTPSASVLKYCQNKRKGSRRTILAFGDSDAGMPLPYARIEAWQVAQSFAATAYLGPNARKSVVKEKLEHERDEIDILHFACHGYFYPVQPLKSGILMAPEPEVETAQDSVEYELKIRDQPISRYLTAEDFFAMQMHADLVTLSACKSGVNKLSPGDELFGLMRALIYAGTPSVVMSLWSVEDLSTNILMQEFYQGLKSDATKIEALQAAQLKVKSLTIEQAIAYCENTMATLEQLNEPDYQRRLLCDIAEFRGAAGDYSAACDQYEELINSADDDTELASLETALARSSMRIGSMEIDYQRMPFEHPYFWAPFILVGDWK